MAYDQNINPEKNHEESPSSFQSSSGDSTIERAPHDRENPYTMISRSLIRDESISPECRWLLIYLLSNTDGFVINLRQVINHLKPHKGRDSVRKLFQEALESGYLYREEKTHSNGYRKISKTYKYYVSETPKFKKSFRRTENQAYEAKSYKKEEEDKKEHLKENHPLTPSSPSLKEEDFSHKKIAEKWIANGRDPEVIAKVVEAYEAQPKGSVMSALRWMEKVYKQKLDAKAQDSIYEKRREWAKNLSQEQSKNYFYDPDTDTLSYQSGSISTPYPIKKANKFWEDLEKFIKSKGDSVSKTE